MAMRLVCDVFNPWFQMEQRTMKATRCQYVDDRQIRYNDDSACCFVRRWVTNISPQAFYNALLMYEGMNEEANLKLVKPVGEYYIFYDM